MIIIYNFYAIGINCNTYKERMMGSALEFIVKWATEEKLLWAP